MRKVRLIVALYSCVAVALGCSSPPSTGGGGGGTTGPDTTQTGDVTADAGAGDTGSADTGAITDTIGTDVAEPKDIQEADSAATDTGSGSDATLVGDTLDNDAGSSTDVPDGGCVITPSDAGGGQDAATGPFTCKADADCAGISFPPCAPAFCDTTTHACKIIPAADGTACQTGDSCGGPGTCQAGACDAPNTCKPAACAPVELKCGDKVQIDLSQLAGSSFAGYGGCSSTKWDGPEASVVLMSDVTLIASLTMDTTGTTTEIEMFDIAPTLDGQCDASACDDSGYYSLTIGVPAGVPRIVMVDTLAPDTGIVTLSMECTAAVFCGDGNCDANEACATCKKDCGECAATNVCGNGKCEDGEDCAICAQDCGACDAGCTKSPDATCGGCACEACVCNGPDGDPYCCDTSWDSKCVKECAACGAKCPTVTLCGDGNCDFLTEDSQSCPNDCFSGYCGDGICNAADNETCSTCAGDCGFCLTGGPASGCGDGKCSFGEDCTTCTKDCGACSDYSCVCNENPGCCTSGFDFSCLDTCATCAAKAGGTAVCPDPSCGDGVCSGETCASCSSDCGDCPPVCGDGTCNGDETLATCKADCATGCDGKCGHSSTDSAGDFCYCDTSCFEFGDCCDDVKQFCCP